MSRYVVTLHVYVSQRYTMLDMSVVQFIRKDDYLAQIARVYTLFIAKFNAIYRLNRALC